ncbi:MFS transporter [Brevibacillus humidisoli]|uniref:MFS transporter n=1 Tax=Brevibacillus humidisoli TaxID=2895522 RepID=UPI001E5FB003|nr:MFS transporter [Brevibacillus humidisoli]UFJ42997.1 MFS transporter [Brevibacillus humidisoli]
MWQALKHKNFRLLWLGQSISALGDNAFQIAMNWLIATNFGSVGSMAMVQLAKDIPSAITRPISGSFIDRYSPKTVFFWINFVMAAAMGIFTGLSIGDYTNFGVIVLFAAFFGIIGSTIEPAFFTAIPKSTNNSDLESANALVIFLYSLTGLIGPVFSAFLIESYGTAFSFGFNAFSFAVAAIVTLFVSLSHQVKTTSKNLPKLKDAWLWIRQNPWAGRLFISEALANFALGFFWVSLPILLHNSIQINVMKFSIVYSLVFLGVIIATILSGYYLNRVKDRGLLAYLSLLILAVLMLLVLIQSDITSIMTLAMFIGLSLPWFDLITRQALQEVAPEELLGRLTSIGAFLTITPRLMAYTLLLIWNVPLMFLSFATLLIFIFVFRFLITRKTTKTSLSARL